MRSVLSQADAAVDAARRIARPARPCFAVGFLTGHELTWMPEILWLLHHELPNVDVKISSQYSPQLAAALSRGEIDAAFLRREKGVSGLAFRLLTKEPLVAVMPADHRLAALKTVAARDLAGEVFVNVSSTAPVLRAVIDNYLKRVGVAIKRHHEADHLAMGMSLIASTRGVALLPTYAENFLLAALTSRSLQGRAPTIDLVLGYRKSNTSPVLRLLLSKLDEVIVRVSKRA